MLALRAFSGRVSAGYVRAPKNGDPYGNSSIVLKQRVRQSKMSGISEGLPRAPHDLANQ